MINVPMSAIVVACVSTLQLLHEVVSKSVYGRNADTGEKKRTVQVQRGHLTDGTPVIGMTMLKADYE